MTEQIDLAQSNKATIPFLRHEHTYSLASKDKEVEKARLYSFSVLQEYCKLCTTFSRSNVNKYFWSFLLRHDVHEYGIVSSYFAACILSQ